MTASIAQSAPVTVSFSTGRVRTGRIISGILTALFALDGFMKVVKARPVVETSMKMGLPVDLIAGIGTVLLVCTLLYAIPRTAVLGAVLLTGYLGGAVLFNLRVELPMLTNTLFPVYMGVLVWVGLYLRDERVRELLA